tara:strand:- start:2676 stop:4550 length:1875 start_codon:yes stop_codon:yes gene_type:complete
MMNPMNPGGLTDDELLRLARLLQQTRGEGLAFINPGEAQMLRDAGGSGEPIPGTQGFGVGGGPIRSYQDDGSEFESNTPSSSSQNNREESSFSTDYGYQDDGSYNYTPSEQAVVNEAIRQSQSGGDNDNNNRPPPPPPPPKYYDKLGREYSNTKDRDEANDRIDTQRAQLETAFDDLTTDQEFETLKLQDPDKFSFADLPEDEVRKKFDEKKIIAFEESKLQTKNLSDDIGRALQNLDQTTLEKLTYDQISQGLGDYSRLSEDTQRTIFGSMLQTAVREARFTLTPEEVEQFARTAIQAAPVDDATAPTISEIDPAQKGTVGEVDAPDRVVLEQVGELNRKFIDEVVDGEVELADYLLQRVRGEATSPAELQLKRATEQNLRILLGASAGTADPAKLRQLRNIFSETSQVLSGQAAELRSREQIDAENRLVQLYKQQGDRELQIAMVNLETKRQEAAKQADLDQVRNLSIQQANLQRVITQANLDRDVELANLDTRRQKALSQGRIDVSVALANLEKDITLSKANAELALRSRALDDALGLAAYQGQMALEGLEVKIDLAEMDADVRTALAKLGIESAEKIAQLNADVQLEIAKMSAGAARYAADSAERAAWISGMSTFIAGLL